MRKYLRSKETGMSASLWVDIGDNPKKFTSDIVTIVKASCKVNLRYLIIPIKEVE